MFSSISLSLFHTQTHTHKTHVHTGTLTCVYCSVLCGIKITDSVKVKNVAGVLCTVKREGCNERWIVSP